MPVVKFTDVGPRKLSWEADIPLTFSALMREVKKRQALVSRDIEFDFDTGGIYVGVFRRVGSVALVEQQPAAP